MLQSSHSSSKAIKALLLGVVLFILSFISPIQGASGCAEIFQRAMQTLHDSCTDVGRNEACYGNNSVVATLRDKDLTFDSIGTRVDIAFIERLSASALDLDAGTWGLSLMKLKANLPDTIPGANVTFLIHGGASVENVSGDMQVFYFTSSLGEPQCNEVPPSSIVVHSPNHERVTFVANGVEINMGSTVVLSAQANRTMRVYLAEGSVNLTAEGKTVRLEPDHYAEIPLGGKDGLEAIGAPSIPVTTQAEVSTTDNLISKVDDLFDEDTDKGANNGNGKNTKNQKDNSAKTNNGNGNANKDKNNGNNGNNGNSGNSDKGKKN